ncbi:hypothetical protein FOXYSP1_15342 [Fusarium oxysporum f. sp. phaseoli]
MFDNRATVIHSSLLALQWWLHIADHLFEHPEQPNISKHFLVGKYGVSFEELWAALAAVTAYKQTDTVTSNDDTTTSDQGTPPLKKPRQSTAPINYVYSGETFRPDDSGPSRLASEGSSYQGSIFA